MNAYTHRVIWRGMVISYHFNRKSADSQLRHNCRAPFRRGVGVVQERKGDAWEQVDFASSENTVLAVVRLPTRALRHAA